MVPRIYSQNKAVRLSALLLFLFASILSYGQTAPVFTTCPATATITLPPGGGTLDLTTLNIPLLLGVDATDPDGVETITYTATPSSVDCGDLGVVLISVTATDSDGSASCNNISVTVDDGGPLAICADFTIALDGTGMATVTTADIDGGSSNCAGGGPGSAGVFTMITIDGAASQTYDCTDIGTFPVTLTVTDAFGSSSCMAMVTIEDDEDPVITCPGNQSVTTDAGICGAAVTVMASATDNCSANVVITNDFNAGGADASDTYPEGTTTVTFSATDGTNTVTCTVDITVTDGEDPVISCPGPITVSNNTGDCEGDATVVATATDNCSVTITNDFNAGGADASGTYPEGTTTVTFTATDDEGNSVMCTVDVTVDDDEDPVLTCPADITVSTDPGMCDAAVTITNPTVDDNCSPMPTPVVVWSEDFDAGVMPAGWTNVDTDTDGATDALWMFGTNSNTPGGQIDGTGMAFYHDDDFDGDGDDVAEMTTDDIDLSAVTDPLYLNFDYIFEDLGASFFTAEYSPDGGTSWTTILSENTDPGCFGFDAAGCSPRTVSNYLIPAVDVTATFRLRFTYNDGNGWNWYAAVDNIVLNTLAPGTFVITNDFNASTDASDTYPVGTTTVTFSTTDPAGNTGTCSIDVHVVPNAMDMNPGDQTVDNDAGTCQATVTWPSIAENCPGDITVTYSAIDPKGGEVIILGATMGGMPVDFGDFPVGTTTVTYTVTDGDGNSDSDSFDVTVNDNEAPTITCGGGQTVDFADCEAATKLVPDVRGLVSASDANCGSFTITQDPPHTDLLSDHVAVGDGNTFTIDVTVTDNNANGLTDVCTMTITLNEESDPIPLIATLPVINFDCGESLIVDAPVAVDACGTFICGEPLPTSAATLFGGICNPTGTVTTSIESPDPSDLPVAITNIGTPTITSEIEITDANVQILDVNINLLDIEHTWVGDLIVTVTAPNGQSVTLLDRPGLPNIGGSVFGCGGDDVVMSFDDAAVTPYSDIEDNCVQGFSGVPDPAFVGVFQPFQSLSAFNGIYSAGEMNGTWTLTVSDNFGGDGGQLVDWELEVVTTGPADVPQYEIAEGNNTIFWIYIDEFGNTSQQIQEINVNPDTEMPTFLCENITVQLDANGEASIVATDVLAAGSEDDNCTDDADLLFSVSNTTFDCGDIGANTVTLTVTDEAGNFDICMATVTVEDNIAPDITLMQVHMDTIVNCDSEVVNDPAPNPMVEDNCGSFGLNLNQTSDKNGNPALCGDYNYTITRTWTATDASGNSEDHVQIVSVQDTVGPVFSSSMSAAASANLGTCEATVTYVAALSDNCAPNSVLDVTWTRTLADGSMSSGTGLDASGTYLTGTNTIEYVGTDPCGNATTFVVTIVVTDDTAPIASCNSPLVIAIPGGATSITITPDIVDNGSLDNCNDVWLEVYRLAANGVSISAPEFLCDEADGVTEYPIVLYVYEDLDPMNPGTSLGQLSTCETTITIQDNVSPEAVCQDVTVYLDAAGNASIVPSDIDGGSFDACSGLESVAFLTGTPTIDYTVDDIGPNFENLIVTDINGNIDLCNATVTVSPPQTCFEINDLVSVSTGANPVTVTATNFVNAIGFQFSLVIDTTVANFTGVDIVGPNAGSPYPLTGIGTFTATVLPADGTPYDTINISWFSSTPLNEGTTPLFDLLIDVVGAVGDISPINFITAPDAPLPVDAIVQYGLNFFSSSNGFPPCTDDGSIEVNEFATLPISGNVRTWGISYQDTLIDLTDPMNPDTTITTVVEVPVQNVQNVIITKEETYPGFVGFPDPMSNTQINANAATTDIDGNYEAEIQNLPGGVDLEVHARKESNWVNDGDVSGSDLFFIQQHIVGNIPFTSIYEYIAADANRDGEVSTLDLVLIQSVIVSPDVPSNPNPSIVTTLYEPWEFVPARDSLHLQPLPANPNAPNNNGTISFPSYTSEEENVDWIAVKIGQVFGSLDPTLLIDNNGGNILTSNEVNERNGGDLILQVENQEISDGELISIPVYAEDYKPFVSWQFTLEFDKNSLAYEGLVPGALPNFGEGKLGLDAADKGIIGAVWYGLPNTIEDDEVLFTLEFRALKDAEGLSGLIDLTSLTVKAQSALVNGEEGNVELEFFLPESTSANNEFTLYQNRPNPFNDKTMISFVLPEAGYAKMTIFDISGKVLKLVEGDFVKGYNEVNIQSSEFPTSGVLYYQLESAEHTATKKMIILD